ncbi:MAG TPA: DNA topoisomerase I [Planctomycetaceae bacterium]|nr:DNA topoisomerase I [Planctomycetaceae bacterium]
MGSLIRFVIALPIFKPLVRLLVGLIAIPLFRLGLKSVTRLQVLDAELEKDLEQWFRGALLLLIATRNMEQTLFYWIPVELRLDGEFGWFTVAMRILLAIGITENMPDQELFAVIHPGPPKLKFTKGKWLQECRAQFGTLLKGLFFQHLNRSSQLFAIMAAIFPGWVGWTCYGMACAQYLIIGLITSRDKAIDVLTHFEKTVENRRQWLLEQLPITAVQTDDEWFPVADTAVVEPCTPRDPRPLD